MDLDQYLEKMITNTIVIWILCANDPKPVWIVLNRLDVQT